MTLPCTGVILAGGRNTRFGGAPKALATVGDRKILDRIFTAVADVFDDIILVTNDPDHYLNWDATIVSDVHPVRSALTGIHTGLFYTDTPHAFVTACDTPFLKAGVIRVLLARLTETVDIIMPQTPNGMEPMCAVYSRRCLESADHQLRHGQYKILRAFRKRPMRIVSEKALRTADPELISFFNINTADDLKAAESMVRRLDGD